MGGVWRSIFGRREMRGSSSLLSSSLVAARAITSSPFLYSSSGKLINQFSDDESEVLSPYERALKYKRPPTKKYPRDDEYELINSVSLIGVVTRPVSPINSRGNVGGAYTVLKVINSSSQSTHRHIWILLNMWGKMAEICTTHLKPDDLIYVSGHLGSYSKPDSNGIPTTNYKVNVMNINYVQSHCQAPIPEKTKRSRVEDLDESSLDRYNNRLHLWQVFFANPLEWYDYRNRKKSPNHPDFRHKDTGEVLWLKHNDPPWIQKQLELQDSRLAGRRIGVSSDCTPLVYDDFA